MERDFFQLLEARCDKIGSPLCIGLDPVITPAPGREREALLKETERIISATHLYAACFKPNSGFFEAWGAPGIEALKETLKLIPKEIPILLDAKRGDIGTTSESYAQYVFDYMAADGVTLSPYMGRDSVEPFIRPGKGLFLLCKTSNRGGADFQNIRLNSGETLYSRVAVETTSWSSQIGLVVSAKEPDVAAQIREAAPEAWFLMPGVGAQGGEIEPLRSALRKDGRGVLPNVSRGISGADNPKEAAKKIAEAFGKETAKKRGEGFSFGINDTLKTLFFEGLIESGSFQLGTFTLKSGKQSPFYIDLRRLISSPQLLQIAARAYASLLKSLEYDHIAGIPVAALPLATATALEVGKPMIFPRMEPKKHGTGRTVEGVYHPGERAVLLDDLITTGKSKVEAVDILINSKIKITDLVVLLERGREGRRDMEKAGIKLHAYASLDELLLFCRERGVIDDEKKREIELFLEPDSC